MGNSPFRAMRGPQGVPGPAGDTYQQIFTNQSTVVVTHNLGYKPSVTIIDTSNDVVEGSIVYDSDNQLTVTLSATTSGTIHCS